jgi:acyl-CoA thioesterase-1
MLARWLIFHVASGQAFFTGAACLAVATGLLVGGTLRRGRVARNCLVVLGGALVFASATPLPGWGYVILVAATMAWRVAERLRGRVSARGCRMLRFAVAGLWIGAMLVELPYHLMPRVPRLGRPVLGVIGDSITAGMGGYTVVTWPVRLAESHGVVVRDHSRAGANVASALQQATDVAPEERLVLIEIGGNDLLGETTSAAFESRLGTLLARLARPGRVLVILELPLPPTYNALGRSQCTLAQRYRALLVPKRLLLGVLQRPGATIDSIHLTQEGQRWLAEALWNVVRHAYEGG